MGLRQIALVALAFAVLGEASASDPYVGVDRVVIGTKHACALAAGRVACWGDNEYGQLGNGNRTDSTVATDVLGLPAPVTALAAGGHRSCAVAAGNAHCWGLSPVGSEPALERTVPTRVPGLDPGVVALAVGDEHACALNSSGGVKCWGANGDGQLGIGSTVEQYASTPRDVVGLASGVARIAAGDRHTCALTTSGAVKCWGAGLEGQLGDGGLVNSPFPVDVVGLAANVAELDAGGSHTCAGTRAGAAKCWGGNGYYQLGDGTTQNRSTPVDVAGIAMPVVAISAGGVHTCARTLAGSALCWGNNVLGQVGTGVITGTGTVVPSPTAVVGVGSTLAAVVAGTNRSCAIEATTRELKCWGDNVEGPIGNGTSYYSIVPVEAKLSASSVALAAGGGSTCGFLIPGLQACAAMSYAHSCAIDPAGGVACWGANQFGQLGNGTNLRALVPTPVSTLAAGIVAVATGADHSCALSASGSLKCWGDNSYGQLGDGTTVPKPYPVDVVGLSSDVVAVSAGPAHTCALTSAGAVSCWGWNDSGQLGDGSVTNASLPRQVVGLVSGVSRISTGGTTPISLLGGGFSCAVTAAGAATCWGNNAFFQMGGFVSSSLVPVDVPTLRSGVLSISAGAAHACAVLADGSVKCWGSNLYGQLGLPTSQPVYPPTQLPAIAPGVQTVAAGGLHTCATTTPGVVHCWGRIGWIDPTPSAVIAQVPGSPSPATGLVSGNAHSCAIGPDQRARCWGSNWQGQLGDGGAAIVATAVPVLATRACAGFADVDAASPFCGNVTWLVNRAVTLGCADGAYCPFASVSRVSMAALMNRLAASVGPGVASDQREWTAIDVYSSIGICGMPLPPASDQARSVQLDAVVTAFGQADLDFVVGFGPTLPAFSYVIPSTPLSVRAGRWTQVRLVGSLDLPLATSSVHVMLVNPAFGSAVVDKVACNFRVRIDNRNEFAVASPAP